MTLAMDLQMYVEREKEGWKAEGRETILMNMLSSGQTPQQISHMTKVPIEEITRLQDRLSQKQ
ncbi:MAG: hypothetical protein IJS50_03750 [Desulfovibrio sp.]|nr:hypothetical protein [Desulfovibrio sp.]